MFNEHLCELVENTDALYNLFLKKFGRYNIVLKEENLQLRRFQTTKLFISEDEAYKLSGTELVNLEDAHFNFPQLKKYMIEEIEIMESEEVEDFNSETEDKTAKSTENVPFELEENTMGNLVHRKNLIYEKTIKMSLSNIKDLYNLSSIILAID